MNICTECGRLKQEFWQWKYGEMNLTGKMVKVKFTQNKHSEWMWVEIGKDNGGKSLTGNLANDPIYVKRLKCDDKVRILRKNISQHMCEGYGPMEGFLEAKEYINKVKKHTHDLLIN